MVQLPQVLDESPQMFQFCVFVGPSVDWHLIIVQFDDCRCFPLPSASDFTRLPKSKFLPPLVTMILRSSMTQCRAVLLLNPALAISRKAYMTALIGDTMRAFDEHC